MRLCKFEAPITLQTPLQLQTIPINHKPLLKIRPLTHKCELLLQLQIPQTHESPSPPPLTTDKNDDAKYQYLLVLVHSLTLVAILVYFVSIFKLFKFNVGLSSRWGPKI